MSLPEIDYLKVPLLGHNRQATEAFVWYLLSQRLALGKNAISLLLNIVIIIVSVCVFENNHRCNV